MANKIKLYAQKIFILTFFPLAACTTQQWYGVGQDVRCDEYRKDEDPFYKKPCPRIPYEEYERQRREATQGDDSIHSNEN